MEAERSPITVRRIGPDRAGDLRLPNEPFPLRGRLHVNYEDDAFSWAAETWPEDRVTYQTFPEEDYDYEAMKHDHFFVGAYLGERCVGLARAGLRVCREVRRMGVARGLSEEGMAIAREEGYRGVSTICQDNNLNAALFYLDVGFDIGGLDTRVYDGTKQEGKRDLFLYRTL